MKKPSILVFGLFSAPLVAVLTFVVALNVKFERGVAGHLKRAADANSVELATQELHTALRAMERRGLTQGYTSIAYNTPDEDLGFWYGNVAASYLQLTSLAPNATQAEKDMVLLKLRQTLLDHTTQGEQVTYPEGAARYPYNTLLLVLLVASLIVAFIPVLALLEAV